MILAVTLAVWFRRSYQSKLCHSLQFGTCVRIKLEALKGNTKQHNSDILYGTWKPWCKLSVVSNLPFLQQSILFFVYLSLFLLIIKLDLHLESHSVVDTCKYSFLSTDCSGLDCQYTAGTLFITLLLNIRKQKLTNSVLQGGVISVGLSHSRGSQDN